MKFKYW